MACDENCENRLWPEKWSKEMLEKKRNKMGTATFNQEYRHIPSRTEDRMVKEEWIKYWDELPSRFDMVIMAIDPSVKDKEENDYTGVCVIGIIGDKVFEMFSEQYKKDPLENEISIKNLNNRFKPRKIIYETNKEYKLFLDLRKAGLPMEGVHAVDSKRERLINVIGDIEFGDVFFRP